MPRYDYILFHCFMAWLMLLLLAFLSGLTLKDSVNTVGEL